MSQSRQNRARHAVARFGAASAIFLSSLAVLGFAPEKGVDPSAGKLSSAPTVLPFKNWGLVNNSNIKSHISALDAWKIEEGSSKVIVAVIDTGIDSGHPALKKNVWKSPANQEAEEYGWNFVTNKANPVDEHGHGTHVAGIIGAVADPKAGVSGVAHNVSIMSVKYYSDSNPGSVNLKNTIKAINYAIDNGAKIINYSGGGPEFSEDEFLAIKRAESKGILFVAAAGNEHQNTDVNENYYYPSAYRLSNILSVAATDIRNNLLATSNWGKKRVDVAAPGENIYSTLPGNRFGYMSGTSQATAFVTGMAALLLSQDSSLTPVQLKEIIMSTVDRFPQLETKLVTGGRVNAYQALLALRNGGRYKTSPVILAKPANFLGELTRTPGSGEFMGPPAPPRQAFGFEN
jgi:thermitase